MITIFWSETQTVEQPDGGDLGNLVIGTLELDILEQDTYDVTAQISTHAVEQGVPFSDHSKPQQDRESFTAVVSGRESTTRFVEGVRSGVLELGQRGREFAGIIVPEGSDRRGDALETLRRLAREGRDIDVDGLQRPVEGWLIESVSAPRSTETAGTLVVDVAIVETRYAEVEEVSAPSPRVERGRRRRDRGRVRPEQGADDSVTADAELAQRQSSLVRIIDSGATAHNGRYGGSG